MRILKDHTALHIIFDSLSAIDEIFLLSGVQNCKDNIFHQ